MNLVEKELGAETNLKLDIVAGEIVITIAHQSAAAKGDLKVAVDAGYFLDKLAEKIPGTIDDAILAIMKSALKAV